jgi:kynurenine formamidase
MSTPLWQQAAAARAIDLAQPWRPGIPHHPSHPPYLHGLTKLHGEIVGPEGHSSASDSLALGSHTGTHIDALCHYSFRGHFHGKVPVAGHQSATAGIACHSVDTIAPILRRGVLLDLAGDGELAEDHEITAAELAATGAAIQPGDVVLLRTGWGRYWADPARYLSHLRGPGPGLEGARWLSSRGVFAVGSDTVAFEKMPAPTMPVHVHLLVDSGIHIIENLNLEELAGAGAREFLFVALPLPLQGATASPVRPVALV